MKPLVVLTFLILTTSLIFGGLNNSVYAQDNPSILLQIAKRAEGQIQKQISDDSSEEIKKLFEEGQKGIASLENSLSNNDLPSAKKDFLNTMKIFTKISHLLTANQPLQSQTSVKPTVPNPSNDLLRMQGYVNSLKAIAKNHNATLEFSNLDNLFVIARNQINDKQYQDATKTIQEIKKTIIEFNKELRQQASQQEQNRAQIFAQKYLKQLDRLIDYSFKVGISEEIIQKFENAKENLSSASTPTEVIKEVRNILLIQQQFELSEGKLLELRINQIEKTLIEISNSNEINQETIQKLNETIQTLKVHLSQNEFEKANELLRSLSIILEEIQI